MHLKSVLLSISTLIAGLFGPAGLAQPVAASALVHKIEQQFKAADKNGDGALTKAEADAAGLGRVVRHFDRIDGNKDGKITRDELRASLRTGMAG